MKNISHLTIKLENMIKYFKFCNNFYILIWYTCIFYIKCLVYPFIDKNNHNNNNSVFFT